ncbi:hypothetical protein [Halobellus rubicundus]|uniref:DUF3368 domain-containing protein n=1 Tax=Halobellus rubicundus TaxID=2996466 RepID=A0ABD5M8P1_9EURY
METYLDATTLIALGSVGELGLLGALDGPLVTTPRVVDEVTTEPARYRVDQVLGEGDEGGRDRSENSRFDDVVRIRFQRAIPERYVTPAADLLGEEDRNGDVELIANVLRARDRGREIGVVSDDRRVRTVADGLDATVTGTLGVVIRAVREGIGADEAKSIVRALDSEGLHLTGELRDTAFSLIDEAARDHDGSI